MTRVGSLPRVHAFMNNHLSLSGKALLTDATHVGFLPRVQPFVCNQVAPSSKAFPTCAAHVRPLTRVQPLMRNQVGSLSEAFLTDGTHIRTFASVQSHVVIQATFSVEGFSTDSADMGHLRGGNFRMISLMALLIGQAGRKHPSKLGFPACVASMWLGGADNSPSLHSNVCTIL